MDPYFWWWCARTPRHQRTSSLMATPLLQQLMQIDCWCLDTKFWTDHLQIARTGWLKDLTRSDSDRHAVRGTFLGIFKLSNPTEAFLTAIYTGQSRWNPENFNIFFRSFREQGILLQTAVVKVKQESMITLVFSPCFKWPLTHSEPQTDHHLLQGCMDSKRPLLLFSV